MERGGYGMGPICIHLHGDKIGMGWQLHVMTL